MRKLLQAVVLALLVVTCAIPVHADGYQVGEQVMANSYCTTREAMDKLASAVRADNDTGYTRIMNDPTVRCYDSQYHTQVQATTVTLREHLYIITRRDGARFSVWRVQDADGRYGYMWGPPRTQGV